MKMKSCDMDAKTRVIHSPAKRMVIPLLCIPIPNKDANRACYILNSRINGLYGIYFSRFEV